MEKTIATPKVLRWARETAGYTREQTAEKLNQKKINPEVIGNWENDIDAPTMPQLRTLSDFFKRPLVLFFFDKPPEEEPLNVSFRNLSEESLANIKPNVRFIIRDAFAKQEILTELTGNINPTNDPIINRLREHKELPAKELGKKAREYLGISLKSQKEFKDVDTAMNIWRDTLEDKGAFVFKADFGVSEVRRQVDKNQRERKKKSEMVSGFCLHHDIFPLIYINNNEEKPRQIFTLFHELGHLIKEINDIEFRNPHEQTSDIETFCNEFASEVLVPEEDFREQTKTVTTVSDELIEELVNTYRVSKLAILTKFLVLNKIEKSEYKSTRERWYKGWMNKPKAESEGGHYYNTRIAYLGKKYLRLAFSNYHENKITALDLSDYTDVKINNLTKLEGYLAKSINEGS